LHIRPHRGSGACVVAPSRQRGDASNKSGAADERRQDLGRLGRRVRHRTHNVAAALCPRAGQDTRRDAPARIRLRRRTDLSDQRWLPPSGSRGSNVARVKAGPPAGPVAGRDPVCRGGGRESRSSKPVPTAPGVIAACPSGSKYEMKRAKADQAASRQRPAKHNKTSSRGRLEA